MPSRLMSTPAQTSDLDRDLDFLGIPRVDEPVQRQTLASSPQEIERQQELEVKQEVALSSASPLRVPSNSKAQIREMLGGGAVVYGTEVNPTDFVPDDTKPPSAKFPDYYRNGRTRIITRVINGETFEVPVYDPIPKILSDRSEPLLASIRLFDPKKIKDYGPNSQAVGESFLIPEFSKFFLEGVSESHSERSQIVQTFNDWYVYFYGQTPPVYQFSGHLLNGANYNWKNEFMYLYENFWRGTKAVELGAKVAITYDYQQVQGYILNINTNLNALTDKAAPFTFNMLVTKRLIFNGTADDGIIRDNLIPQSDTGLINITADDITRALSAEVLNKQRAPSSDEVATVDNERLGTETLRNAIPSVAAERIPGAGINPFSTNSAGAQRALKNRSGIS